MSTFLQVVELLLTSNEAKADYANDPSSFLDGHGLGSFDSDDVADAMGHAADALPMSVAVQLDPDQGLDSAAGLDLDAEGLSLDREPIEVDDADDIPHGTEVDPYGADGDVDFDVPDSTDGLDPADVVDALDTPDAQDAINTSQGIETTSVLEDVPAPVAESDLDNGDYLTDVAFDLAGEGSPLDAEQLDDSDVGLSTDGIDEIDTDLSDDVPDGFDLLD